MASKRNTRKNPQADTTNEAEEAAAKRRRLEDLEREASDLRKELEDTPGTSSNNTSTPRESFGRNEHSFADTSSFEVLQSIVRGIKKQYPSLPTFSGDLSGFEYFYDNYKRTTEEGIPPHENMKRLKEALKGDAYNLVSGYFDKPHCLDQLIEDLKEEYGDKVSVTRDVLKRCEKLPKLESNLSNIKDFMMAITSMKATVEKSNSSLGELAVELIQGKLDHNSLIDWGRYQLRTPKSSETQSFHTFSSWLNEYKQAFQVGGGKRKNGEGRKERERENKPSRNNRQYEDNSRELYHSGDNRREDYNDELETDWRLRSRRSANHLYGTDHQPTEQGRSRFDRFHWTKPPVQRQSEPEKADKLMLAQQTPDNCGLGCKDKNNLPDKHTLAQCK